MLPPPPTLPLEVKHEILKFCDPSTLARTSRVSLAFLQLSSPLLYRDVDIRGFKQLQQLFIERDETSQPHLSPLLDLNQMKTFSFTEFKTSNIPTEKLSLDRTTSPILLDRLVVFLPYTPCPALTVLLLPPQMPQDFLAPFLFPLFNPTLLHVQGVELSDQPGNLPLLALNKFDWWSNLRGLSFKDANTSNRLSEPPSKTSSSS